ncbi:putative ABC transporter ATP-binding protein [Micrococcus lylae]|uniref:Putative ABC transporter ATP-binding protein n=1 Tax=Micrococcus lylae TaxID=1273 RepID=A0A1R4JBM2_9MICC|nr:ABC transporter ATP-binding protein [Micrococcus lylae]SJN29438.1 putative ABC transporter ATP-binding protein [Micrococcus lylae]
MSTAPMATPVLEFPPTVRPLSADAPMSPDAAVSVRGLARRYGEVRALQDVSFDIAPNTICGLLGANGAGKTTLMSLISGQDRPSAGTLQVFGREPFDDAAVLTQLCFARENQAYPDTFAVRHVLTTCPLFLPHWDADFADELVETFRLPLNHKIRKLSRGQLSAVAIVAGLASRAPLTFLDEPYLGLDPTARRRFYDALLRDYAEHPRTILMSTHLIGEVEGFFEQVLVIDDGRLLVDASAEDIAELAFTVSGPAKAVEAATGDRQVLETHRIGGLASAVVLGTPDAAMHRRAAESGLEIGPVGLQDLIAALGAAPHGTAEARAHDQEATR